MRQGIFFAILAAALYALNMPFSKLLLNTVPATLMAGLLYLGAGLGMLLILGNRRLRGGKSTEKPLTREDLPFVLGMILLDIAAPIFLMTGLRHTTSANASLLNNFEIVATALIALLLFRERISPRLWVGIGLVTTACVLISFEDASGLRFSCGSLLVLLAAACWGLENNCTRRISDKDPLLIVLLKGIFSGGGSLLIGLLRGERLADFRVLPPVLLLGFVAYGLSIAAYIRAQNLLGAARTGAYYAIAPFIGVGLSFLLFREIPGPPFYAGLLLMLFGAVLCAQD